MHDDPPMTDEIAARFYPRFESRWRKVEVAGRVAMLLVVVATLFGLTGGGPIHLWTWTASADGLAVTYQPIARFGTPSGIEMRVPVDPGAPEVAVTLPDAFSGGFDLQSVTPQPVRWEPGAGSMRLVFKPMRDAGSMVVHLGGLPPGAGVLRLSAKLDGHAPLSWSQFIIP